MTPAIPFETYELDNGLKVVLAEDHSTPIAYVTVWYHVGSKNEVVGRTGFAHLFEHLMFQGSLSQPGEYFELLEAVGADVNGSTNTDRTNYHEAVPAEYLPLALYLESDRMGWLLDVLDTTKLDNQREVVRNERRQNYENPPYGLVRRDLMAAIYPEGHPYHHLTIGDHADLQAASVDDVKAFFRTWYAPDNATLVIAGDFDPKEARTLVAQYFAGIPKGPERPALSAPDATIQKSQEIRQYQDVPEQRVWIAYTSPPLFAAGDADLDLFSSVLTGGKDARLYYDLVKEKQIAKSVTVSQQSGQLSSTWQIQATAAPGHTTDEIVAEIDRVLQDAIGEHPPTAQEVDYARNGFKVGFYDGLLTIEGKAETLAQYDHMTGDPGYIGQDLQRYLDATPESVLSAAKATIAGNRVVFHVWPLADQPATPAPAPEGGAK